MAPKASRTQLVNWVNEVLNVDIEKVDELGNGAEYCQILDTIFGDVPMNKVSFDSKSRYDWEANMRVLQGVFLKHNITRPLDTARLLKCRLQDNLEFSQWLINFWDSKPKLPDYDPVARRKPAPGPNMSSHALRPRRSLSVLSNSVPTPAHAATKHVQNHNMRSSLVHSRSVSASSAGSANEGANDAVNFLQGECAELEKTIDILMAERDFFYSKLRDVENIVNDRFSEIYEAKGPNATMEAPNEPVVVLLRQIQDVLFATPEGFEIPPNPNEEPF